MVTYFLEFKNGALFSRYRSDVNPTIPAGCVEVTEEMFNETITAQNCTWQLDKDKKVVKVPV